MKHYRAELHCHTRASDGTMSVEEAVARAGRAGLHVLAVTDHDIAEPALAYWKKQPENGVLVIPGEEITTDQGHVLAYFIRETIGPGRFEDVVHEIHRQGGIAMLAHPVKISFAGFLRGRTVEIPSPDALELLDGIEIVNGHVRDKANRLSREMAGLTPGIVRIAGSDAHYPFEIGNAVTQLTMQELSLEAAYGALKDPSRTLYRERRFNAYGIYLARALRKKIFS